MQDPLKGGVYWVEMEKPNTGGLGFSLVGAEKGGKTSVFIKTVTPGGITHLDGRIKVGDKMLQVNGQSTVGMTQKKVISLLRKAQGTVKLALASAKPPPRPASFISTDVGADTDPEPPTVPPLDLPGDLGGSDSDHERKLEENNKGELSSMDSFKESKYTESQLKTENYLLQNDQLITTVTYDSSLLHTLSFENLRSLSLLTPPPPEFDASDSTDRDTDSDIDSTADLPDDSLLDLLDDSGNAVAMETALRATRQFGKVLKDKIQGKDDLSFGSDIGFPLSSENSSLPSEGESSDRSARGHSEVGASVITDQELAAIQILQVPSSSCKLYSGKQLKSIITVSRKKSTIMIRKKNLRQVKAADACEVARKPENRDKNRFRNVLPYDTTRVVLQTGDSDYVNASHVHVKVASSEYHYIACQGPLPQTTKDFWAMVWEQGVEVIAMVTLDFENGKVKCHKYWPSSKDEVMNIDEFEIKLEEVSKLEHFHIRQLLMTHKESNVTHHVTHLNFTSWPDHSVPDSAMPLLRYIRYMRKLSGEFNPVVVHCSAGIGRTGTLMTIDSLLNMIEADQEFKIEEIVKDLRLQRQGMIQTKDQYLFCYKAAVEALKTLL
ncbi:putative tyrosine-protein phosphatase non-receptor type 13 [Apostichopus japonicus]|uniref:protein-tyrosine-phosphatase n=1 Tax=Stichopus japonicus TaxID=307972 RepID=A0A2G8LNN2_STIJA|nr:putative tyrosine-protein phosphatase non-receptor type 13 [Apostichopus japonicus]